MATLEGLTTRVAKIVRDPAFTADIPMFLNQGVVEIAGGVQSVLGDHVTPPLPDLLEIDTVMTATDSPFVSMPETFHRGLVFAATAGRELDIAHTWQEFMEVHPALDRSGRLYEVIERGGKLYYQGVPTTSEVITIHFYRLPVIMEDDDDAPDGIPLHLQDSLLVNFACYKIFELIEDGIEGEGVNTKRYERRFLQALRTLELSIPRDTRSMFLGD